MTKAIEAQELASLTAGFMRRWRRDAANSKPWLPMAQKPYDFAMKMYFTRAEESAKHYADARSQMGLTDDDY